MSRPAADGPPTLEVAGATATIRLRRPAEHNRIDPDDVAVIRGYLDNGKLYPAARALVFTGTGDTTFSSGYTVDAIVGRLDRDFEDLLDAVERFPLPTICALNGSVYGGATDLALCCDFRLGVRGSRMFMPAARFGLHYYPGGLRRAVAALGAAQAKRVFLTAQTIDADEMLRIGFLAELLDRRELPGRVEEYVGALAECDPGVVRSMKRQIDAIAAGDRAGAESRSAYEASLGSDELRRRLARTGRQG
jgi:enoyl-CoA hydratase/carnithine racemase